MLAQIGGQTVDVAAELQDGIFGWPAREGTHGRPDGLRLRPPALACPGFEAIKILVVEVDLERAAHDQRA